jgi:hypothetical protein
MFDSFGQYFQIFSSYNKPLVNRLNKKWVYIFAFIFMLVSIPTGIYLVVNAQHDGLNNSTIATENKLTEQIVMPTATPITTDIEMTEQIVTPTENQVASPTKTLEGKSTQTSIVEQTPEIEKTKIVQNPPYELWKEWPIVPNYVSDNLKQIYKEGLENGNNPHAFSILGDCHSLPEVFLGIFDTDPNFVKSFDPSIQETVAQFQGSFDRYSPTVKIGTTEGALLWPLWNDNKEKKCEPNENSVDCEIRVHKPSIVIIQVGTHYESRNEQYMITILEKLLENGTVPIIVTKADNRELDERINETLVKLAAQYDLPVWNFWASVQHLDTKGLDPEDDMYLSDAAYTIHQDDGIKVLDFVWHSLNSDN